MTVNKACFHFPNLTYRPLLLLDREQTCCSGFQAFYKLSLSLVTGSMPRARRHCIQRIVSCPSLLSNIHHLYLDQLLFRMHKLCNHFKCVCACGCVDGVIQTHRAAQCELCVWMICSGIPPPAHFRGDLFSGPAEPLRMCMRIPL